jgi:AcrR family transcriptional regulator
MAQRLKDATQARIARAALALFAERGYEGTTMEAIAGRARVSAGNIYRYYRSKQVLFGTLIDDDFVDALVRALGLRRSSGRAAARPRDFAHAFFSDESVRFASDHRLRVIILLGRARGSRWEGFAAELEALLCRAALAHFGAGQRRPRRDRLFAATLARIYRHFIAAMVELLAELERPEQIARAMGAYARYHRAGIERYLD